MAIIRDSLSTRELEAIARFRETIRESCRLNTISNEEIAELMKGLSSPFASLISVLAGRRARLAKLLTAIEREREKVLQSVNTANPASAANIEKAERLERLINDYIYLNEGLRRTRGGRRPSRTMKKKGRKER